MSGLRLLQIDRAYLEGDFDHFPGELKWLSWKGLPSECIPTISHLEKLSVLDLSRGMITDDWSGWQHIQLIKTLKVLDLRDCLNLTRTPDFSRFTSLKRLILDGCEGLVVCHESIGQLKNLDFLSLNRCGLVELPEDFGRLSSLKSLSLSQSKLRSLPASFSCLSGLHTLDLRWCTKLRSIPELPSSLIKLNASGCSSMERLPELSNLKFLQELYLSGCGKLSEIQGISGFSCLSGLHTLDLNWCTELRSIPELPSSLIKLDARGCSSMERLPELSNLKFLEELDLLDCKNLSKIQGISGLPLLQTLDLSGCKTLQSLPELPSSLVTLNICDCISMEILPNLSNLKILESIGLVNCKKLVEIQGMKGLVLLQNLNLVECGTLQSLPELPLGNLRVLVIKNCRNLSKIQGISCLPRLQILTLKNCKKLQSLPMLPSSLIWLEAYGCISLERLPDMSNLKNLEILKLKFCHNLAEIRGLEGLESLILLNLYECHTCVQNFPKIVAQGILPSASYDGRERWKEYLIPDDDNINGMVFFMVFKLPTQFPYDSSDTYDSSGDFSDFIDSSDDIIKIWATITRNDGKRISCGISIRLKSWENTDIGDQLYSCYFQGLTWFGIPLQKGDILDLSAVPSFYRLWDGLDAKMIEFAVAYEAIEDDQQLEKGVKHLITSILEYEPRDYDSAHNPYRMPSVSGGRREC